ncbi:MAG: tetratricopeptide repeat protein [Elusimicrobiota bacterium]
MDTPPELARAQKLAEDGSFDDSIAICDAVLAGEPDSAAALSLKGWCLDQQGKREEALRAFQEAVKHLPVYAPLRKQLGQAYADFGRAEEAVAEFSEALRLDPKDADALIKRGACRLATTELKEGLQDIKDAVAMDGSLHERGEEICRAFAAAHKLDLGL